MKRPVAAAIVLLAAGGLLVLNQVERHPSPEHAAPLRVIAPVSTPPRGPRLTPPTPRVTVAAPAPVVRLPVEPPAIQPTADALRAFAAEPEASRRLALLRAYAAPFRPGVPGSVPAPADAEDLFRRALEDPSQKVSLEAMAILATGLLPTGGALLEELLGHATDPERRQVATLALAEVDGERALPQLVFAAEREPTVALRVSALDAIARVAGPEALATLDRFALSADCPEVRSRAASLANRVRATA